MIEEIVILIFLVLDHDKYHTKLPFVWWTLGSLSNNIPFVGCKQILSQFYPYNYT